MTALLEAQVEKKAFSSVNGRSSMANTSASHGDALILQSHAKHCILSRVICNKNTTIQEPNHLALKATTNKTKNQKSKTD
jgi:hypothetical protein